MRNNLVNFYYSLFILLSFALSSCCAIPSYFEVRKNGKTLRALDGYQSYTYQLDSGSINVSIGCRAMSITNLKKVNPLRIILTIKNQSQENVTIRPDNITIYDDSLSFEYLNPKVEILQQETGMPSSLNPKLDIVLKPDSIITLDYSYELKGVTTENIHNMHAYFSLNNIWINGEEKKYGRLEIIKAKL